MAGQDRQTQSEKALLGLRSLVLSGDLEANARLPETALAERLGISRTPLRQAMDRLVGEGLLERLETGGCRVACFTPDDIADALELRGVAEGTALRLAAERGADPDLLDRADHLLARLDEAVAGARIDLDIYIRYNSLFHALIARLSGSRVVAREVERACSLPLASPNAFLHEHQAIPDVLATLPRAQEQHRAMIDAVRAREGARAEFYGREHVRIAHRNLVYVTKIDPTFADRIPGLALVATD